MSINFEDYKNKKGAYDDVAARRFQLQMLDDGEEHPEDNVDTTFSKEYDEQQFDRMMEINSKPGLRKKREFSLDPETEKEIYNDLVNYYEENPEEKAEMEDLVKCAFSNFNIHSV